MQYHIEFVGIDSATECGTLSNVYFVYFVWRYFEEQFVFPRHAITILPDPSSGNPRLLFLRYYNVASVGWSFGSGCVICRDASRQNIRPLTGCVAPGEAWACNICRRQPPSLRDLASHAVFPLPLNIERFEFTRDVTHRQYRYAVDSNRVDIERRLPSDFPSITLQYTYRYCPNHPCHSSCSPGQPWIVAESRTFDSEEEEVAAL